MHAEGNIFFVCPCHILSCSQFFFIMIKTFYGYETSCELKRWIVIQNISLCFYLLLLLKLDSDGDWQGKWWWWHEKVANDDGIKAPLTPADQGKVPGSGNTVVPVPAQKMFVPWESSVKMVKKHLVLWKECAPCRGDREGGGRESGRGGLMMAAAVACNQKNN